MSAPTIEAAIEPLTRAVLAHPFVTGLADGTLAPAAFRRFLLQDRLFLEDFGRALALCGSRAADSADLRLMCGHAAEALQVERELHEHLVDRLRIRAEEIAATSPSPTCLGYGAFLVRACAVGRPADGIAALAPCYLMFRRVGTELAASGSPDASFAAWIATYDGDAFGQATDAYAAACERALGGLDEAARASAVEHALIAARYEWMFWQAAWRDETWPDPGAGDPRVAREGSSAGVGGAR
jgi:thiaminase (transcriptional activator TenA)